MIAIAMTGHLRPILYTHTTPPSPSDCLPTHPLPPSTETIRLIRDGEKGGGGGMEMGGEGDYIPIAMLSPLE